MECPVNLETLERSPYPDIKMGKDGEPILIIPTAEQMISWLEDNKCYIDIDISSLNDITWEYFVYNNYHDIINEEYIEYHSRQEAILAAIDVALDYLINKK